VYGVAVAGLAPGLAAMLPKHLDLRLSLTGLPASEMQDLAVAALAPRANAETLSPRLDALFNRSDANGPPMAAIDALRFDLGPARFDAQGSLTARSAQDVRGAAHIAVFGFDALFDRLRADPETAQGLILLFIARAAGRQDGDTTVWDIAITPDALTINGIDPRKLLQSKP
jgi:hypothetical protein